MTPNELEFYGLVFFSGYDLLPRDVPLSLEDLRQWAARQGLISDPEFQLLSTERFQELAKCFSSTDRLQIAIAIHPGKGDPFYMEYPYLPVRSLIQRAEAIEIIHWRMVPMRWDANGNVLQFGEVRFGFLYPGCSEEMCSISTAKRVTEKFGALLAQLSDSCSVESSKDGSKEITVDGTVRAKFSKDGRSFDVDLWSAK